MADLLHEKLLSFADASRALSCRPHVSTIWRWYRAGVRGRRLRTVLVGGRRYTTEALLAEFIGGLTCTVSTAPAAEADRRTGEKSAAAARAAATF